MFWIVSRELLTTEYDTLAAGEMSRLFCVCFSAAGGRGGRVERSQWVYTNVATCQDWFVSVFQRLEVAEMGRRGRSVCMWRMPWSWHRTAPDMLSSPLHQVSIRAHHCIRSVSELTTGSDQYPSSPLHQVSIRAYHCIRSVSELTTASGQYPSSQLHLVSIRAHQL